MKVMLVRQLLATALVSTAVACGGEASPPPVTPADPAATAETAAQVPRKGGPSVQNELGEIDQKDAERAFATAEGAISGCHKKGLGKIEYLAGDIGFLVRVGTDGKAKYVVVESSSLGDRATERCMVDALSSTKWPVPQGGEAEARKQLSFTPGDAREPATWQSDKVAGLVKDKGDAVNACKKGGSAQYHVTAYVQPSGKDGKIQSLGVAASSPDAFAAADCVVDALKSAKVPSPGSYAAKVTFDF
jgi:hypothetical protein